MRRIPGSWQMSAGFSAGLNRQQGSPDIILSHTAAYMSPSSIPQAFLPVGGGDHDHPLSACEDPLPPETWPEDCSRAAGRSH